ncbi:ABC transporter ATP-binding protein [Stutzerimonas kunmingensis]|uniref:ABC transporter ATP-binding protein n=1 Tax=Stutzerimonas kunmingensis TaxID=1211807 RepID=UPI00241D77A7|nr:ABC transporter ATP-binding protein [Stutzerimonas kunmingensis]
MKHATQSIGHLTIEDAVKVYRSRNAETLAVDHCSLDIRPGEICMIVGPSGCGKTTLLNAVAGFHGLTSGRITLDGELLCGPGKPMAEPGPDRVVVFQNGALFPWMTVLDNVTFGPLSQRTMAAAAAREKARELLADSGLAGMEHRYPEQLSSGVRRRVEIARAMMNDPAVLLLDEPYRALDSLTRAMMHEALLEMHARRPVTILFITHDLEEAVFLGHRIVVMSARPCRPTLEMDIDMPHPRDYSITTSDAYRRYVESALDAVHLEAQKSFAANETEARP